MAAQRSFALQRGRCPRLQSFLKQKRQDLAILPFCSPEENVSYLKVTNSARRFRLWDASLLPRSTGLLFAVALGLKA